MENRAALDPRNFKPNILFFANCDVNVWEDDP